MAGGEIAWLERYLDMDELVEMARALVRADTSNPPGHEAPAARWLQEQMPRLGFEDVRLVEPLPGRVSVVGRFPGGSQAPGSRTLLWNGHIDVVPVGDPSAWRYPPFEGVVADGRLWGRGSADMKGAVAAILEAAAILHRAGLRLRGTLLVHAVADEEMLGDLGTRLLVEQGQAQADAAICGEPTSLRPLVAARGLLWVEATTFGRSCHASTPHLGVNAIVKMSRVVQALAETRFAANHPLLGHPTLSVGTIAGGTKTNVVPDRCTVTVDRRLLPGESPAHAFEHLKRQLDTLRVSDPDLRVELRTIKEAEPSEISADEPIVRSALRARALLGLEPVSPGGMPGTTDARFLVNQGRVPAVILGPGELEQAHTVNESISLEQLRQAALLYAAVVCDYLGCEDVALPQWSPHH